MVTLLTSIAVSLLQCVNGLFPQITKGSLQIEVVAGSHETFVLGASGQQVASIVQKFLKQTPRLVNGC